MSGDSTHSTPSGERTFKQSVAKEDMPRERFVRDKKSVSDVELIAIMLGTGTRGQDVIETARIIYETYGRSLIRMGDADISDLKRIKGLGDAKAITLAAALELGSRRSIDKLVHLQIRSSRDCHQYFFEKLAYLNHEEFRVAAVDTRLHVIGESVISSGGMNGTVVDIRRLMSEVLRLGGVGFFVAHNHPSGSIKPSKEDLDLTRRIAAAARTLDLRFRDHVIVARGSGGGDKESSGGTYFSFADEGLID